MKVLFDTNVLIASAFEKHSWHEKAVTQIERVLDQQAIGYLSVHSLAEFYAVSTRYPVSPMPPKIAHTVVEDFLSHLIPVEFTVADYQNVILRMSRVGIRSGGIFDALIAQAALKTKVDQLITFNSKHFSRLGKDVELIVFEP